jgi:hypothetical protein
MSFLTSVLLYKKGAPYTYVANSPGATSLFYEYQDAIRIICTGTEYYSLSKFIITFTIITTT